MTACDDGSGQRENSGSLLANQFCAVLKRGNENMKLRSDGAVALRYRGRDIMRFPAWRTCQIATYDWGRGQGVFS
jgi:hypothetical protein